MRLVALLICLLLLPAAVFAGEAQALPGPGATAQVARVLVVLLLVIGAIFGLAALARRHGGLPRRLPGAIRIVSVASLGARERLVLVEVGKQQLLVGATPGRIQSLLVLDEPVAEQAPAMRAPPGFAAQLRDALGMRKPGGAA